MATRTLLQWAMRNNSTDTESSLSQPVSTLVTKTFRTLALDIQFPFEPYGVQKVMMNTITRTLMNMEHSLIESPTGTGKTLALICASLAWQKKSKTLSQPYISARVRKKNAEERKEKLLSKACTCGRRSPIRNEIDEIKGAKDDLKKREKSIPLTQAEDEYKLLASGKRMKVQNSSTFNTSPYFKKEKEPNCINIDDGDDDVIIIEDDEPKKPANQYDELKKPANQNIDSQVSSSTENDKPMCRSCAAIEAEEKFSEVLGEESVDGSDFITAKVKAKVPRIYYGTRTHKQITQVVRELNKTPYRTELKMCILSSRERTCINDDVKDSANRNDLCQELLKNKPSGPMDKRKPKGDTCQFHTDSNNTAQTFSFINDEFNSKAWDIEDAAEFGRQHSVCPYYGARSLQTEADITFCPYNYLLDPTIRKTLDINLHNAVIIFDEAHNIEDICRDSASFVIDTKQIDDILETIQVASNHYVQGSVIMDAYQFFRDKFMSLKSFLINFQFTARSDKDSRDYLAREILSQGEMLSYLNERGLGPDCLAKLKENLKALRGDDESDTGEKSSKKDDTQQPALSFIQMQFITQLTITLEFMYTSNCKFLADFRAVLTKSLEREFNRFNSRSSHGKRPSATSGDTHLWQFSLLCMNSGIAFEKIHSSAWSVIVASGTLSPIESLKSELGCTFTNVFEGAHVIKEERIFASILSSGPNKVDLNCAFANSLKLDFQDEVGRIVRDVCVTVPNGVLCFFPSYDRMENFYQRWFAKGLIMDIQKSGKKLFREKKNLTAADFEKELANYNTHAKMKGALLFAVFRGKVSEGIDFANEAARAVITIGIPYPNIKEVTVGLKKDYNDVARSLRPNLMGGRDWYASQAFRALNQALGRCIRHQNDWGAIIMIDSRLRDNNSIGNISKWLRKVLNTHGDYSVIRDCLKDFVDKRSLEG